MMSFDGAKKRTLPLDSAFLSLYPFHCTLPLLPNPCRSEIYSITILIWRTLIVYYHSSTIAYKASRISSTATHCKCMITGMHLIGFYGNHPILVVFTIV